MNEEIKKNHENSEVYSNHHSFIALIFAKRFFFLFDSVKKRKNNLLRNVYFIKRLRKNTTTSRKMIHTHTHNLNGTMANRIDKRLFSVTRPLNKI